MTWARFGMAATVAALIFAAASAPAQTLPAEVARSLAEDSAACRDVGGTPSTVAGYATTADLNGDGRTDYVIDLAGLSCAGAPSFFCGSAGCPVSVWLSGPGGYFVADAGHAQAWRREGTTIVRSVHGQLCNPPRSGVDGCEMRRDFAGLTRPAGQAAVPATGWELRRVANVPPVATVAGVGSIASVSAFCLGDQPWLAVVFAQRPTDASVRMDFGFTRGSLGGPAVRQQGTGDAHVISLRGSELASLLAGRDSEVAVAVNGMPQGRLTLRGSSAALRSALAPCLRL